MRSLGSHGPQNDLQIARVAARGGWVWIGRDHSPRPPAGHILQAGLDAFNSGDRARIEAYVKAVDPRPLRLI